MPPKPERRKSNRASQLYNTMKATVRADLQLFHFSAPYHMEYPRPLEPKEPSQKLKRRPTFPFRRTSSKVQTSPKTIPVLPRSPQADQSQSGLLQLPEDIRRQIWIKVLGGHLLFGGTVVDLTSNHKCYSSNDFIFHAPHYPEKTHQLLNLLLTCQQINAEASSLLHSSNLYYTIHLPRLGYASPVSPLRLPPPQHVRALALEVHADSILFANGLFLFRPSARPLTPAVWEVLAHLPALRVLLVNLISHAAVYEGVGEDRGNAEADVFRPLRERRGLEVFEVVVRWKCGYKAVDRPCLLQLDYADAPFRLTEIVDHVIRDQVVRGSEEMINVRAWAAKIIPMARLDGRR